MAHRWEGILNLSGLKRGRQNGFRVFASLACSSRRSLLVPASNAIFFVGDRVKDSGNPTVERLSQLENIAAALLPKLGQAVNLWIIEPSHYLGPFACYENILPSLAPSGEPTGYNPEGLPAAWALVSILQDCLAQVKAVHLYNKDTDVAIGMESQEKGIQCDAVEKGSPFEPFLDPVHVVPPTILLGFSKGGVILNQILAEIVELEGLLSASRDLKHGIPNLPGKVVSKAEGIPGQNRLNSSTRVLPFTVEEFLHSIEEVHYVDVGLNCYGAYQTDPGVLEGLAKVSKSRKCQGFFVGFHGTPRQWQDKNRKWVAMEKTRCVGLLMEAACRYGDGKLYVSEKLYFGEQPPNLQMHFEIIDHLVLR